MRMICRKPLSVSHCYTVLWTLAVALAIGGALPATADAGPARLSFAPLSKNVIAADWQGPLSLPPRFRNHCRFDIRHGRVYCSNHCGLDYQFYFCSPVSFGCCHINYGYCDWKGTLRCAP